MRPWLEEEVRIPIEPKKTLPKPCFDGPYGKSKKFITLTPSPKGIEILVSHESDFYDYGTLIPIPGKIISHIVSEGGFTYSQNLNGVYVFVFTKSLITQESAIKFIQDTFEYFGYAVKVEEYGCR